MAPLTRFKRVDQDLVATPKECAYLRVFESTNGQLRNGVVDVKF